MRRGLVVCSTWLTIALLSVEHPTHRMITVVAAGRSSRVLVASVLVAVLGCSALAAFGVVLPLLFGDHPLHALDLLIGLAAQLTCAAAGIGIGLVCSRLVFRRQGYPLIVALGLVLVVLLVPGLPPVNRLLRLVGTVPDPVALVVPVGGLLAISVALLVAAAALTQFVTTRRD